MSNKQQHKMNPFLPRLALLRNSLRVRILVLVFVIVLGTVLLMAFHTLARFEEASVFQLEHEALLLSDVLEAAIVPLLTTEPDVQALQGQIDRVAAIRKKNDIEINIMLLQGHRSSIVASNIPDNIEQNSIYEHRDMLAALEKGKPIIFIGRDIDSESEPAAPPNSPDYFIRPGQRFVSITTPLVIAGRKMGSINTKLSLSEIDRQINKIRSGILLMSVLLPGAALLLVLWAVQKGLRPLGRLTAEVAQVDLSSLSHRFSSEEMPLELQPIIARLNELLERLETAFQRERRFTANVAHELRTPIATLKTLAEVGIQESSGTSHGDSSLDFYQDTLAVATQMEQLVVNLLGFVRCESGLQSVNIGPVNLGSAIENTWERFRPRAKAKQIYCQFNLTENAVVHSDQTLFEAMLRNLFSNAVTYTNGNGSILCTLEKDRDCFLFTLTNSNNHLEKEDLENLFEPFWRKDESRTDQSHFGIGLSLVSAYAKLLGIKIKVELPAPDLFQITLNHSNTTE